MIIANAAHDRALMSDILSGMRAHEAQSLKSAILALDAAAAREPVYVQGCDELRARTEGERAAHMEGLEEGKKIAARQPVGSIRWLSASRRKCALLSAGHTARADSGLTVSTPRWTP